MSNQNVVAINPVHKMSNRIAALAIALAVVSLAAASGPRPEATEGQYALVAAAPSNGSSEFVYFPSQYVNQATESSEHIQAF